VASDFAELLILLKMSRLTKDMVGRFGGPMLAPREMNAGLGAKRTA
jgi:hypothetical protein